MRKSKSEPLATNPTANGGEKGDREARTEGSYMRHREGNVRRLCWLGAGGLLKGNIDGQLDISNVPARFGCACLLCTGHLSYAEDLLRIYEG